MAQGYINPQLLAVLAAQGVQLPSVPQDAPGPGPAAAPPPDPQEMAVHPDIANPQPLPALPQFNSINQGINSVGRPSDLAADPTAEAGLRQASEDDKELRKLKRQAKGDALMALGAGLLSAPNLQQGLSQGIMAYAKAMQEARGRFRPKHEDVGGGAFDKVTDALGNVTYNRTPYADFLENKQYIVQDGKLVLADKNNEAKRDVARITADAGITKTDMTTKSNERVHAMDNSSDERIAQWNNASRETVARINGQFKDRKPGKVEQAAMERARVAPLKLERYDRIEQLLDGGDTGAGAGFFNKLRRGAAEVTGMNIGGVNVAHKQQLETEFSTIQLEAAQLLQGQGQVSDAERRILASSVPSMATDPAAVKSVLQVLRNVAQRDALGASSGADGNLSFVGGSSPQQQQSTSTGVKWRVVH